MATPGVAPRRFDVLERALAVLADPALDPIVDMALTCRDAGYEAVASTGRVHFRRAGPGEYEIIAVDGENPIGRQDVDRFIGLDDERRHAPPHRRDNSYPFAFDHIAQLFDHPAAPDICVVHSAGHNWEDQGGHRGEHGSLGIVQSRAPLVLAGCGVRADGWVPRSARLVDLAPTIAELLGCTPVADDVDAYLSGADGRVLREVLDPGARRPRHVVGFLFDGTNANVLYAMAAAGEAPNVARLLEMGTAFGHGAFAGLPSVTLANHTSILTGRLPGHHGILHNAWFDRRSGRQVITNSSANWPTAMQHLDAGVETLHQAIHRTWPDAFTASVNEPCDVDASFSTFEFFRRGEVPPIPTDAVGLPHTTERFVRPSKDYASWSVIDHMAVEQAVGIWSGHYRDVSYPAPRFMWVNFALTDTGMHEGGPYSDVAAAAVRDTDARLGEILRAIEHAGVFDETAFVLVSDHGMEETDPDVRGDWDVALRDEGIAVRDEGYGFLYLDA
jgi:arylsulfatase A-like enzyme